MVAIIIAIVFSLLILCLYIREKEHIKIKKIKNSILSIILLVITIGIAFLYVYRMLQSLSLDIIDEGYVIMAALIVSITISVLIVGVILLPIIKKLYEVITIRNSEKKYKFEKIDYFRDTIKDISPDKLSFCYNRKMNIEDDVVMILLNLKRKKIININEDEIIIIGNKDDLSPVENFVLNNLNFLSDIMIQPDLKKLIIKDMVKDGYAVKLKDSKFSMIEVLTNVFGWTLLYALITLAMFAYVNAILGLIVGVSYVLLFIYVPIYAKFLEDQEVFSRTEKGLDVCAKLKGLKKYLKDFSIINESGVENIALYDEYVIYAILFNQKGKLDRECKKIYENTKHMIVKTN